MNRTFVSLLIFIIISTSCSGPAGVQKQLVGSWQIVMASVTGIDGKTENKLIHINEVKIFNDTHFSFGYQEGDSVFSSGGGLYKIKGDSLFEYVQYHSKKSLQGKEFHFKIRFDGNHYFQRGIFDGQITEEEWERIK